MALMSTLKVIPNWADPRTELSPSWQFINLCWQSVFVFLPLMVAYNASKKLGADPWVGFAVMAVVMLPGFAALRTHPNPRTCSASTVNVVDIFGLPLTIHNYSSQVFFATVDGCRAQARLPQVPQAGHPRQRATGFVPFLANVIMIPLTAF